MDDLKIAEAYWIQACREPGWKGAVALAYFVFGFKPEPFHIEWLKKFFSDMRAQTIVAPRGSAKTTYFCIAMLKYIADNPWDANGLLSVSVEQAKERLAFIRGAFDNERFNKVYPWLVIDTRRPDTQLKFNIWDTRYTYSEWRANITQWGGDLKSPTLVATGTGGRGITGSRITGILGLDDVSDEKNASTEEMRQQLWNWLVNTVMPILSGMHYRVWSISTLWAKGDVPSRQKESGYEYTELKAITRVGNRLKSFWSKQFNFKELLHILNRDGKTSFLLARMNSITGLSGAIFTADMLRTDFPRDEKGRPVFPEFDTVILSVDAAIFARESNDDSSLALVGIRTSPNTGLPQIWVLKMLAERLGNMEVLDRMEQLWHIAQTNYRAKDYYTLIETVAGQQLFVTLMEQKPNFSIPMRDIETYTPIKDKAVRARPVAAVGERGDFILDLKASWYDKMFSQYIEFTGKEGSSDDMVDVISQVGAKELGDTTGSTSFNPTVTTAVIEGLTMV